MVMGVHPTISLDIIEIIWLVKYPERMLSREELIKLRAMALAKHVAHIEKMREKVTKEKIRRTLQLERDLQHKIEEFDLGPGSLVLVKNSAIEMSADRKMKPRYLRPVVVVRKLQGGTYILAELSSPVWQNKVAAFRVLLYLSRRKLNFNLEVKELLDASEENLRKFTAESDRDNHIRESTVKLFDWE